ncbi:MAG: YicC family protein [Pirellulaceae bacterium]|nr:YicC family protein [Pirellulaceae bacterium]
MTGHGEAVVQHADRSVGVEVRTVNNRYFKLTVRAGDGLAALESRIEALVRQQVRRGTVQVTIRLDRQPAADSFRLNSQVLAGYRRQLEQLYDQLHIADTIHLESLLALPGVVVERTGLGADCEQEWALIEPVLREALAGLTRMRADEGRAMAVDLSDNCRLVARELEQIAEQAPRVVAAYRDRLTERLNQLLAQYQVSVEPRDVIREVGLFAERSDISEELVRLRSHLDQFQLLLESSESNGRKLDFLTQEMFRETNTIGAKANDAGIARHVIEIKAAIERIREMIQNVE